MSEPWVDLPRELAAVWFADIVGYTPLMSHNEQLAHELRREFERLATGFASAAGGRIVKRQGDGAFASFPSALAAVDAALKLRDAFSPHRATFGVECSLRIGADLGDVIPQEDGDIHGNPVNLAARLTKRASPGEILVSSTVAWQLGAHPQFSLRPLGPTALKGIASKVSVYAVDLAKPTLTPNAVNGTTPSLVEVRWIDNLNQDWDRVRLKVACRVASESMSVFVTGWANAGGGVANLLGDPCPLAWGDGGTCLRAREGEEAIVILGKVEEYSVMPGGDMYRRMRLGCAGGGVAHSYEPDGSGTAKGQFLLRLRVVAVGHSPQDLWVLVRTSSRDLGVSVSEESDPR